MIALQDRNEVLFYRCLTEYLEELLPIIYTPVVGLACLNYSALFRRPRGMYFSAHDKGAMNAMIYNWPSDTVRVVVVTDGSRILGLGDLGVNGHSIPIGKLSLYCVGAGFHPDFCLPACIDVGTNNEDLIADPLYVGLPMRRVEGAAYFEIVDECLQAIHTRYPQALIQFEDFSIDKALPLLEKYRNEMLCFNDDIQGTGCVIVSSILGALRALGHSNPGEALSKQRIVMVGAGSAGQGVCGALRFAMMKEGATEREASECFWMLDKDGLLGNERAGLSSEQKRWTRSYPHDCSSIVEVIESVHPTVIIGLTGVGGIFNEAIIRAMAKHQTRPIILALSNPTSQSECTAEQAYVWSDGRALFASGSPFAPVVLNNQTFIPCQANNFLVFPAIGLAAISCQARKITDDMLYSASKALAEAVTDSDRASGHILPSISNMLELSARVAYKVIRQAEIDQVAQRTFATEELWMNYIRKRQWKPSYAKIVRVT